jgi:hypothetical protein
MQSEQAPVLRFNVAAFLLCGLTMVVFGCWMIDRRVESRRAHAIEQIEIERTEHDIQEIRSLREQLDAKLSSVSTGCTLGSHSTEAELQRQRDKIAALREAREDLQERIDVIRCRQQAGCTIYSPVY